MLAPHHFGWTRDALLLQVGEKQKLLSEIANRANASSEFAGRDFSMILDLLKEHANT